MINSKYGKIISIATSVCIVLLGIAFIVSCSHLFFTAEEDPYSRARVGEYLIWLTVPSFITIAFVVCGFVYAYLTDAKEDELTARTNEELLQSFASRFDFESFDDKTKTSVLNIRRRRNIIDFIASEFSALCFVLILDYFIFFAKFSVENLNGDIISAFAFCLPLATVAVAIHIPRLYLSEKSCKEELLILKNGVKSSAKATVRINESHSRINITLISRYAVISVAVLLVILGILNGGMNDVFGKAIRICTECIGLG